MRLSKNVNTSGVMLAPLIIKLDNKFVSLIAINNPIIPPSLNPYKIGFLYLNFL